MPEKRASTKSKVVKTKTSTKASTKTSTKTTKLDLYARHRNEYLASAMPALVKCGPARYLAVPGRSKPGAEEFTRAVGALYTVAFTIKMARKSAGTDYVVTKLEGLWWLDNPGDAGTATATWNWQVMLRVPTFVNQRELRTAIESLVAKGKDPEVQRVQLVDLNEGQCVQLLHVGPYTEEQPSIAKMRDFAGKAGRKFTGKHHEIYLSDPRRVKPEKIRTILRNPVEVA